MIVLSDSQYYSDIANAIRAKNGESTQYKPSEMALAIKSLQGGGGIPCTLIVKTSEGAVVTATLDGTTISATAGADGVATLVLEKEGVWTVSATLDGETKNTEVLVEHSIEESLSFVDPILENNTWETISKVAKKGKASEYWNIGDTKTFMFQTKVCHAQIIGFDHDDVSDPTSYGREKAGITFQLVELPAAEIYMNSSGNGTNSYVDSSLHGTLVSYFNSYIDSEAKSFIVTVNKDYEPTYSTTAVSAENLFLLSEAEYAGAKSLAANIIGTQYAFWAAGNSLIKYKVGTGTVYSHWTRSRGAKSTNKFVYVKSDGSFASYSSSASTNCCPFAFCL